MSGQSSLVGVIWNLFAELSEYEFLEAVLVLALDVSLWTTEKIQL